MPWQATQCCMKTEKPRARASALKSIPASSAAKAGGASRRAMRSISLIKLIPLWKHLRRGPGLFKIRQHRQKGKVQEIDHRKYHAQGRHPEAHRRDEVRRVHANVAQEREIDEEDPGEDLLNRPVLCAPHRRAVDKWQQGEDEYRPAHCDD